MTHFIKTEGGSENINRVKINYLLDLLLTALFFIIAGTGILMYFFIPSGIQGGGYVVYMGLTKNSWLWIHSKVGILMTVLVVVHFILHWKWIVYTTKNFFKYAHRR